MKNKRQFREIQRLNLKWLLLTAVVVFIPLVVILYQGTPLTFVYVMLTIILPIVILYLLYAIRLKTIIDQRRIRIKFFPLANRNISWDDVESVEIVNYGFVGWGVRKSPKWGIVYNTHGPSGMFVKLKSGQQLVIGSQHPDAMNRFLMNCIDVEEV